jgi:uncharacterized membrane protein
MRAILTHANYCLLCSVNRCAIKRQIFEKENAMNELPNTPISGEMPPAPEAFYQVWIKAVTKPNEQTYADLAASPDATPNKAYLWVFLTSIVSVFFVMLAASFGSTSQYGIDMGSALGSSAIALICGAPIGAAIGVLFFAIDIAILQWVAKMFKGVGSYNQLIYAVAAFSAPLSLISGVISALSLIPYIGFCFSLISIAVSIYTIVLMVMAVKGVNKFGWGEAVGSVLLPGLVIGVICACIVIVTLMLLGPVIGNVFSTINQSLGGY